MEKNLTKFYEDEIKRMQENSKEAQRHLELIEKVVPLIPGRLPVHRIHPHTYKGDVTIQLETQNRSDVYPLLEILPPMPLVVYRDSSVAIFPEEKLPENPSGKIEYIDPDFWWETECEYWNNYKTRTPTFEWYTKLGELVVKVEVEIKNDPAHYQENHERYQGRIIRKHWFIQKAPSGTPIRYASGTWGEPGHFVVYNYREDERSYQIV